jgi:predicted RND superfamily exporter protein
MGFVQRKLVKLVIRVVTFPKLTLGICAGVLAVSVVYAFFGLHLSTDEDQLLTPKLRFFREYKDFSREFPENDAFVVILEPLNYAKPPLAQRWMDYADRISAALSAQKEDVVRVDSHVPPNEMGVQGLAFDTWDNVRETSPHAGEMAQLGGIVGDPNSVSFFGVRLLSDNLAVRTLFAMQNSKPADSGLMTAEILRSLANAVKSERKAGEWTHGQEYFRMWMADPRAATDPRSNGYNVVPDETKKGTPAYEKEPLLVITVHTARDYSSLSEVAAPLNRMRDAIARISPEFPDFKKPIVTGRAALEADQMQTSDQDTRKAEILGLSLVFVVLFIFLRNLWLVIAAELCLGTGIGWTFGWATLMVGRLNLLSLVFVIALIGIGMDYLIQILVRYRFEKKR